MLRNQIHARPPHCFRSLDRKYRVCRVSMIYGKRVVIHVEDHIGPLQDNGNTNTYRIVPHTTA